jgi:glycosyltransferase involved in cell wall biosynthesis
MRIGFDAKRYFYNRTGLGNYSRTLVNTLAQTYANDHFVLFTPGNPVFEPATANLHLHTLPKNLPMQRLLGIARHVQQEQIDVFHGLSNEIPLGLKRRGIASVVTIHDVIFRRFPEYYPAVDRFIYHRKTAYAVKHADVVIATSQATANDLQEFYSVPPSKIQVLYQPIDPLWYGYEKSEPPARPYFLYISSFTQRKNHGTLIQAFSAIHQQTDCDLLLAGAAGPTLEQCKRFVQAEGLTHRVHFETDCEPGRLRVLAQQARTFVYPSLFEGFGIPLAEAAAKGLPLAVSDTAIFRELAGEAALYFNPNRAENMAAVMLDVLRPEYAAQLQRGRETLLAKIKAEVMAEKLMGIYRELRG